MTKKAIRARGFTDLGFARPEPHRISHQGIPEAIYCPGKKVTHILSIFQTLSEGPGPILATRVDPAVAQELARRFPKSRYYEDARMVVMSPARRRTASPVLVLSAGTADLPVAEEAAITAEALGASTQRIYDVGVAGIHRLLRYRRRFKKAGSIVVCAGMEGALPSVVGGLASCPVIAVPTSVGYGANLGGITALLGMLNSCAPNVTVVNIDDGFGAGVVASLIAR